MRPDFGMTEHCAAVIYGIPCPSYDLIICFTCASIGSCTPRVTMRVVGDNGIIVFWGDIGDIQVSGPVVFKVYFNNPEATHEVFTDDCWYLSGDGGVPRLEWDSRSVGSSQREHHCQHHEVLRASTRARAQEYFCLRDQINIHSGRPTQTAGYSKRSNVCRLPADFLIRRYACAYPDIDCNRPSLLDDLWGASLTDRFSNFDAERPGSDAYGRSSAIDRSRGLGNLSRRHWGRLQFVRVWGFRFTRLLQSGLRVARIPLITIMANPSIRGIVIAMLGTTRVKGPMTPW